MSDSMGSVGPRDIGLALSGGGSRAIAFHLGCMRTLHEMHLLDRVTVVSGISGGSIMAAAWAYGSEEFEEFDRRMCDELRRGFTCGILRRIVFSRATPLILVTNLVAVSAAVATFIVKMVVWLLGFLPFVPGDAHRHLHAPFPRWASRTTALQETLDARLFKGITLTAPRRNDVEVVLTACDLRTGSAFRFGSTESGCWRIGRLADNSILVAEAVTASAAYPILLPALDKVWRFVDREGDEKSSRVVLTDGGVFDNLGTTCMDPERSTRYSYDVFHVDYIISCDAGQGLWEGDKLPFSWLATVSEAFAAVFRKAQDRSRSLLFDWEEHEHVKGVITPYLGIQDDNLPSTPSGFVTHGEVHGYGTDFSRMRPEMLEALTKRGEQVTRILIEHHHPELSRGRPAE